MYFPSCRWGNLEFPLPFGRVMSATESFIHGLDEKVNLDGILLINRVNRKKKKKKLQTVSQSPTPFFGWW